MTVDPLLNLTEEVEARRQRASVQLEQSRRIELGQFFTPSPIAAFLTSLFDLRDRPSSLLDPGAGVGSLTAAFVARWGAECNSPLSVTACEVDSCLHDDLSATLASCQQIPSVRRADLLGANFIEWSAASLGGLRIGDASLFTYVVMNPPYRKLANGSHVRNLLRSVGLDAPNLYAAFLALGARILEPGGQLVAITPRSFANGPYFRSFRRDLLSWVSLRRIHVYDSRDVAFADAEVLQENVVFLAERCEDRRSVFVASSSSPLATDVKGRFVPYDEVVDPGRSYCSGCVQRRSSACHARLPRRGGIDGPSRRFPVKGASPRGVRRRHSTPDLPYPYDSRWLVVAEGWQEAERARALR